MDAQARKMEQIAKSRVVVAAGEIVHAELGEMRLNNDAAPLNLQIVRTKARGSSILTRIVHYVTAWLQSRVY